MTLGHDILRPVGWSRPIAVHFEPGLTRLVGLSLIVETDEESERLFQSLSAYLQVKRVEESRSEIEELRELISRHLQGQERAFHTQCVAFAEPGLAARVLPEIFGQQDKDGLIPLDQLTPIGPGVFQVGDLAVFAHPYFRRSLSRLNSLNAPFLEQVQSLADDAVPTRIALDTDMVGLASTYREYVELEYWWGPKFDDNLASIPVGVTHHEANEYDCLFHGIQGTQFMWQSRHGQHLFEVEELRCVPPWAEAAVQYGCRYVHSIVQEATGEIIHLDGAIRMYSKDQMVERLNVDIAHAGRHTQYTKLWRIEGVKSIPIWKRVISDYFRDNRLIGQYFGAPAEEKNALYTDRDQNAGADSVLLGELAPYSMAQGTGVRVALSYHPQPEDSSVERRIVSLDTLSSEGEHITIVELDGIEVRKALERLGSSLFVPEDVMFLACKDFYVNLPLILHSEASLPESLHNTLDAIRMLVGAWKRAGHDRVASYSVAFPVQDKEVRLSVLGHVADLEEWLSNPLSNPPMSQDKIRDWAEEVSAFLNESFPEAHDKPSLFKTLMPSGILLIDRKPIEGAQIQHYWSDEQRALKYELAIPKSEAALMKALEMREFSPAFAFLVLESRCSNCGLAYLDCGCSKLLDDGVGHEITKARIAFPFWTDRPVWQ